MVRIRVMGWVRVDVRVRGCYERGGDHLGSGLYDNDIVNNG